MANKRDLKRNINYVCSELLAECLAVSLYNGESKQGGTDSIISSIIIIHNSLIRRISHIEPGMKPKGYYDILKKDLNKHVSEIIDQIGNIN